MRAESKTRSIRTNIDARNTGCGIFQTIGHPRCVVERECDSGESKKRILFFSEAWGYGGIESVVMQIAEKLDGSNFDFDVYSTHDSSDCHDETIRRLHGSRYVVFSGYRPSHIVRFIASLLCFDYLLKNNSYHIVHIHAQDSRAFVLAWLSRRRGVKQVIVHSHNSDVGSSHHQIKMTLHRLLRSIFDDSSYVKYACSQDAGEHLFDGSQFTVIYNGIDVERFRYSERSRNQIRSELRIEPDVLLIGNPSRLAPAKNPQFLIDVFAAVAKLQPNSRLLLLGEGEEELNIRMSARELGIDHLLTILSPRMDVEKFYSAMDVMLFPSKYEGLALVCVEAQASGLNIVASDVISGELVVSDLIHCVSLEDPVSAWAKTICDCSATQVDRGVYCSLLSGTSFDSKTAYSVVLNRYAEVLADDGR